MSRDTKAWYTDKVNEQIKIRIKLSAAAYAYELDPEGGPIMTDEEFDQLALKVDLSIKTRRAALDKFFIKHFNPSTGNWIRFHPDLPRVSYVLSLIRNK